MTEDSRENQNFSLFSFKFPFLKSDSNPEEPSPMSESAIVGGRNEVSSEKPDVVRLLRKPLEAPSPLKLEVMEESGKTSNPLILWQVYAIGGFLVVSWFWGRWKERHNRKRSEDDDDDEGTDGYHSPANEGSG